MCQGILDTTEVLAQPLFVLARVDRVATKMGAAVHKAKEVERGLATMAALSGTLVGSDVYTLATSTQSNRDPATMLGAMPSLRELDDAERLQLQAVKLLTHRRESRSSVIRDFRSQEVLRDGVDFLVGSVGVSLNHVLER